MMTLIKEQEAMNNVIRAARTIEKYMESWLSRGTEEEPREPSAEYTVLRDSLVKLTDLRKEMGNKYDRY